MNRAWRSRRTSPTRPRSTIVEQVANGVSVRMAVLYLLLGKSVTGYLIKGAAIVGTAPTDLLIRAPEAYTVEPAGKHRFTVPTLDYGIKRNVARWLAARGIRVHVLPRRGRSRRSARSCRTRRSSRPAGQPGHRGRCRALARNMLSAGTPLFGICFGSRILGIALCLDTYKLGYGYRWITQPVLDRAIGKVKVTRAQQRPRGRLAGVEREDSTVPAALDGPVAIEFSAVEVSQCASTTAWARAALPGRTGVHRPVPPEVAAAHATAPTSWTGLLG